MRYRFLAKCNQAVHQKRWSAPKNVWLSANSAGQGRIGGYVRTGQVECLKDGTPLDETRSEQKQSLFPGRKSSSAVRQQPGPGTEIIVLLYQWLLKPGYKAALLRA